MGWGIPWTNGPYWALPVEVFQGEVAVEGTGFVGMVGNSAAIIAPIITTLISITYGWNIAFYMVAAICSFGLLGSLALSRMERNTKKFTKKY
jgi:sugar phosphate permease